MQQHTSYMTQSENKKRTQDGHPNGTQELNHKNNNSKKLSSQDLNELGALLVNMMRQYKKELDAKYGAGVGTDMLIKMLWMATAPTEMVKVETEAYKKYGEQEENNGNDL